VGFHIIMLNKANQYTNTQEANGAIASISLYKVKDRLYPKPQVKDG